MAIVVRENFLDQEEIADLFIASRTLTTWDTRDQGYWHSRIAHADQLEDIGIRDRLVAIQNASHGNRRSLYA